MAPDPNRDDHGRPAIVSAIAHRHGFPPQSRMIIESDAYDETVSRYLDVGGQCARLDDLLRHAYIAYTAAPESADRVEFQLPRPQDKLLQQAYAAHTGAPEDADRVEAQLPHTDDDMISLALEFGGPGERERMRVILVHPDPAEDAYPYVATVHRPGLPDAHLGFHFAHQAKHATWSLRSDFTNTAHVAGSSVTWSPTPDGVTVQGPLPTDRYALAELIAAEDRDQPIEHLFPDLFSQLKAQHGYEQAVEIWRSACAVVDDDGSEDR